MATIIIRRTNPNLKVTSGGRMYECSVCRMNKFRTWDEAVACAEKDFARRDAERKEAA